MKHIFDLDSKHALDPLVSGGKGASLAWLRRQGFRTPPGFVITTSAFADVMAVLSAEPGSRERLAELLTARPMPVALERSVRAAYRRLGGRVAVRSSMTGEDREAASYAGQFDTALGVEGADAVIRAAQGCWASAFNTRAAVYAGQLDSGAGGAVPPIAVVVQRMVDPQAAGVAFSADPTTGQRDVLIEAVRGLGDRLVGGLAEPDRYLVDGRGVLAEAVPVDPTAPALAPQQVLALTRLVREVARRRGVPVDVEWAWDGAEFHLLQARPITSLAGQRVYSNRMVADMAPGLVKPLVYSISTVGKACWVFGRIFTELIGPNDYDFARLVPLIRSRVYADMTMLGELLERVGLPANFLEMMSRDELADFRHPNLDLRTLRALLRLVHLGWRHARPGREITAFLAHHEEALAPYRATDWAGAPADGLLEALDRLIAAHEGVIWYGFIAQFNMMGRNHVLARVVSRSAPDVVPGDLIRGLVGLKALEPNAELHRLAACARAMGPDVPARLQEADEADRRSFLAARPGGRELLDEVEAFITRYGHLSTNGSDFSVAPWIESPDLIWRAIGRAGSEARDAGHGDAGAARDAFRQRVRARQGPIGRLIFDRLLTSTTACIHLREHLSDMMSHDSYHMRRVILALARSMVARGDLADPEEVFLLTYDEARALAEGRLADADVRERIVTRRAAMAADAEVELPATICGDYIPAHPARLEEGQEYLSGIRGSSGRASGYARVVLNPARAPADLRREHILVVPFTDVGWTPLFPGIGGIVAETGGQLSHTSIVAREYGLPAVVSVRQATHLIQEGQPITVDGDAGRVYLRHVPAT